MARAFKGLDKMARQLGVEVAQLRVDMAAELYREAVRVMSEAKPLVPVKEGVLRNSGHVQRPQMEPSGPVVELGFGGPAGFRGAGHSEGVGYAVLVHEDLETFGQSSGGGSRGTTTGAREKGRIFVGQAKYLETPVRARRPTMPRRFAMSLRRRILQRNARR